MLIEDLARFITKVQSILSFLLSFAGWLLIVKEVAAQENYVHLLVIGTKCYE